MQHNYINQEKIPVLDIFHRPKWDYSQKKIKLLSIIKLCQYQFQVYHILPKWHAIDCSQFVTGYNVSHQLITLYEQSQVGH